MSRGGDAFATGDSGHRRDAMVARLHAATAAGLDPVAMVAAAEAAPLAARAADPSECLRGLLDNGCNLLFATFLKLCTGSNMPPRRPSVQEHTHAPNPHPPPAPLLLHSLQAVNAEVSQLSCAKANRIFF